MPSVSAPSAARLDHGLPLSIPLGKFAVCCTCKRILLYSMEDLWNAISPILNQYPEGKSRVENRSRTLDLSTLLSCEAGTHLPREAISITS